jgi:MFS family permease
MGSADPSWGALLVPGLFVLVLLTRGLGQSALSVVSLALMGRSVGRKPGLGVGVYSFVTALGFMAAFATVKRVLETWEPGWRPLWCGIGAAVAAFGLAAFTVLRPRKDEGGRMKDESRQQPQEGRPPASASIHPSSFILHPSREGLSLGQALLTPAFWVFAGATSLYGMVAAGVSLFNQSILSERHFDRGVFLTITTLTPLVGLAANLATGWLGRWVAPGRLLAAALMLLTAAMLCFPLVRSLWHVYLYAAAMGVAGGMVTVIFFGVWGQAFGTAHLGKIQGAAQMLTVLASAAGPLLLAAGQRAYGSYVPVFQYVAAVVAVFGVAAWLVPLPRVGSVISEQ